jgi:hypothetical protein
MFRWFATAVIISGLAILGARRAIEADRGRVGSHPGLSRALDGGGPRVLHQPL